MVFLCVLVMIKPEIGKDTLRKKERNTGKSKGKGKLTKEDIGTPSNFRYVFSTCHSLSVSTRF